MNLCIVAAMAALGIGGGFAGLAWGWREGEREARIRRQPLTARHDRSPEGQGVIVSSAVSPELRLSEVLGEAVRAFVDSGRFPESVSISVELFRELVEKLPPSGGPSSTFLGVPFSVSSMMGGVPWVVKLRDGSLLMPGHFADHPAATGKKLDAG